MLEGVVANVPPQGGRKHPEQQYIQMDTTHILFVCGGSFEGIEELIQKRLGRQRIGFSAESAPVSLKTSQKDASEFLGQITPQDVLQFGLIPELVGRLPVLTPLMPLSAEHMVRILTEPRNAIIRQYQHLFQIEGAGLEFTDDALTLLAERAMARGTGARALRAVLDEYMLNLMYDLPDLDNAGVTYVLDADSIERNLAIEELPRRTAKESA